MAKKRDKRKKKRGGSIGTSSSSTSSERLGGSSSQSSGITGKSSSDRLRPGGDSGRKKRHTRRAIQAPGRGRESRSRRGLIPIALKFGVPAVLIVALSMTILGIYLQGIALNEVKHQTNLRGSTLVTTLAKTVGVEMFKPYPDYIPKYRKNRDRFSRPYKQASASDRKKYEQYFTEDVVSDRWLDVFKDLGSDDLLDARIVQGTVLNRTTALAWIRQSTITFSPTPNKSLGDVDMHESTSSEKGQRDIRVRMYRTPIVLEKRHRGFALVFLRADKIDAIEVDLTYKIYVAVALGILLAAIAAVLVAITVTVPIRSLVRDMKVVSAGRLDHRASIDSRDEVGLLAETFNEMTDSLQAAREAEVAQKAFEHELNIATEIQTKLLPERIPKLPGYDMFSFYLSAKEVGGDYYDFIVVDEANLGIVVADVSGKGVPGSMVMTMARSLLRLASHRNTSPSVILQKVNRHLAKDMRRGMFVTCLFMLLDVRNKKLNVCSAGHNPLVHYVAATDKIELVNPQGIALGFDKGPIFESNIQEQEISLAPGDRIVIYTDGVVEAMDRNSQEFGEEPFYDLVREHASLSSKAFIQKITDALNQHRGDAEQSDDITITTLRVKE